MNSDAMLPAWIWMWLLAIAIYGVCKIASWSTCTVAAPTWKHVAYLVAWPGMDCDAFLSTSNAARQPVSATEWLFSFAKFGLGIALMYGAAIELSDAHVLLRGWTGMIGIVLTLHFGLFHVMSCAWRSVGVAATPLMNWPVLSESATEFWGRRWNLAFRDLTHRLLFIPLKSILGPAGALLAGFAVSGLVHDLVISGPGGAGWGLPTLYFVLQGAGLLFERSRFGRASGLGTGSVGRLYCFAIIALPSPLLLHPPFVNNVIVPFLTAIGGAV